MKITDTALFIVTAFMVMFIIYQIPNAIDKELEYNDSIIEKRLYEQEMQS